MTSLARILANRRNAQLSTGPKSKGGKARSARNAYQHGLAGTRLQSQGENDFIQNLTEALCTESADPVKQALAQLIAEQEFQILRARSIRRAIFADESLRIAVEERRARSLTMRKAFRIITKAQDFYMMSQMRPAPDKLGIMTLFEFAKLRFYTKPLSFPDGFKFISARIKAIDRYERRAISKRNTLIRQFVSLGALHG